MTEDKDRLILYKKYGGWQTVENWMKLAISDDFKNYFEVLKKFSLLREYQRNGFDVEKIMAHPKFEVFTAIDIYRLIRGKTDRIHTVILTNSESEILNTKITNLIDSRLKAPDMGLKIPFPIMNDLFRGIKGKRAMCVGMLSNAGKSRFMFKIIAYIALVLKEKVSVMLNEMSIEDMRMCLLTTVINNDEFQECHGYKITKCEKELSLGLYKDKDGNYIYRTRDEWGDFTETLDEFIERVANNSKEYHTIKAIAEWIENETQGVIFAKDVSGAYDDKSLEFEIRKSNLTSGVKYFFYDTLKQDTSVMDNWAALKSTTTRLSELAKELNSFVYASIQLTDETNYIEPDELTSSQIANAKQLKHVLDNLVLAKEVLPSQMNKYKYLAPNQDWGEPTHHELDNKKRYYIFNIDKNRDGGKKKILFEINLDLNTWYEIGEVFKK